MCSFSASLVIFFFWLPTSWCVGDRGWGLGVTVCSIRTRTCWNGGFWIKHACSFCFALLLWWDATFSVCLCVGMCVCAWDGVCPSPGCPTLVGAICPGSLLRCFNILHLVPSPAVTCRRHSAVSFTHQVFPHFLHSFGFTLKKIFFPFLSSLTPLLSLAISPSTPLHSPLLFFPFSVCCHCYFISTLGWMLVGSRDDCDRNSRPCWKGFRKSCKHRKCCEVWLEDGLFCVCGKRRQGQAAGGRKSLVWYGYNPDSGRLELLALMCWLLCFSGCVHTIGLSAQLLPARPSRKQHNWLQMRLPERDYLLVFAVAPAAVAAQKQGNYGNV